MKTKIRLAGESWSDSQIAGGVIWEGDMPLVMTTGMRVVDETNEQLKVYQVSQVAFHFNDDSTWQTLFVVQKAV